MYSSGSTILSVTKRSCRLSLFKILEFVLLALNACRWASLKVFKSKFWELDDPCTHIATNNILYILFILCSDLSRSR